MFQPFESVLLKQEPMELSEYDEVTTPALPDLSDFPSLLKVRVEGSDRVTSLTVPASSLVLQIAAQSHQGGCGKVRGRKEEEQRLARQQLQDIERQREEMRLDGLVEATNFRCHICLQYKLRGSSLKVNSHNIHIHSLLVQAQLP